MDNNFQQNKNAKHEFDVLYKIWLGIVNLFQTFEDLESVKDKQADIQAVRQVIDEAENDVEVRSC